MMRVVQVWTRELTEHLDTAGEIGLNLAYEGPLGELALRGREGQKCLSRVKERKVLDVRP